MAHMHSSDPANRLKRRDVWQSVPCSKCGALAGQRCIRKNGQTRFASHQERWAANRELKEIKA